MVKVYVKINEFLNSIKNYKKLIDYTNLSEILDNDKIKKMCKESKENKFHSICVLPKYVASTKSLLDDNTISVCSVIDFPKGEKPTSDKIKEINESILNGADEIDVVLNFKLIKNSEDNEKLKNEIREISEYCHREGVVVKVIIEIGYFNYQELENICKMCIEGNTDFIMTSTGKLPNDNTFEEKLEKVKFMRKILPDEIKIKFSGGIRTEDQISELSKYVDRIGTSIII